MAVEDAATVEPVGEFTLKGIRRPLAVVKEPRRVAAKLSAGARCTRGRKRDRGPGQRPVSCELLRPPHGRLIQWGIIRRDRSHVHNLAPHARPNRC
jgi:hypothetical protein